MPDLDALDALHRVRGVVGAAVPFDHFAQIGEARLEIAPRRDVAQVVVVFVGAGDHVAAALERLVGEDLAGP